MFQMALKTFKIIFLMTSKILLIFLKSQKLPIDIEPLFSDSEEQPTADRDFAYNVIEIFISAEPRFCHKGQGSFTQC